jgi:uncharacterized protein (DUF58 family)
VKVTVRGWGLVVGSVALYAAGLGLGYAELTAVAVAGSTAALLGLLAVGGSLRVRVVRTVTPERVERGKRAWGEVTVTNVGLVRAGSSVARDLCGDRPVPVPIPGLGRGRSVTRPYKLPTDRRGVIPIGPLQITRRDPFGLYTRSQRHGDRTELWVRPVVHPLGSLPVGSRRSLDGPDQDTAPHGSITFDRLREWQHGDDLRHVHWRSTARTGVLMVKEHVDTSLPRITVVLDDRAMATSLARFEEAVEVAASVVVAAVTAGYPATVLCFGGAVAHVRSQAHDPGPLLDLLTRVERTAGPGAEDVAARSRRTGRSSLVVVTGSAGVGAMEPMLGVRRHFENTTVVVIGDEGVDLPTAGDVRWLRAATATAVAEVWSPPGRAA